MHNIVLAIIISISIIFADTVNASENSENDVNEKDEYKNFSFLERTGTGLLNIIPGLGSLVIMGDVTGAAIQWAIFGGGTTLTLMYCSIETTKMEPCPGDFGILLVFLSYYASFKYSLSRCQSYDKPQKAAFSKTDGFNAAILPSDHGNFKAYLLYNKAF